MKKYNIKVNELEGRGIYSIETLKAGTVIMSCELLVLSPEDTLKVNETALQHYTFKFNETQDCLVLGDGEIFNHSDTPNCEYILTDFEDRKIMSFVLIRDIKAGEQIYIDYNSDIAVDVNKYLTTASLVG